jgi:sugar O-acyltransferase (sialic acid O-acetyltransferase NeuD family)
MSKPELILIGAGGHAHSCIDVIERCGQYQIAGLIGMPKEMRAHHLGYPVIATDSDLPELAKSYKNAFIAVGQIESPEGRIQLYRKLLELGYRLPTIISPLAHVSSHARIGAGCVVMHGAVVNAGARVGNNCIINTRALVEHDAVVADHCHISTGAILNGNVRVGEGSYIGSGTVIKEGVVVGNGCLVGMALPVRYNQADGTRFVGEEKR